MKRRRFVWLSLAGTALLGMPSLHCGPSATGRKKILARPEVLSRCCDPDTIRAIGVSYRDTHREENNERRLEDLLLAAAGGPQPSSTADPVSASLRASVTGDFQAGRILKIKGWILSRTEARQCALFSFT